MADDKFVNYFESQAPAGAIVALSEKGARELFDDLKARGRSRSDYYIPFNNPTDYCYVRAEQMATDPLVSRYARQGVPFAKIWLATPGHKEKLRAISLQHGRAPTPTGDYYVSQQAPTRPSHAEFAVASEVSKRHYEQRPDGSVTWSYHVALISLLMSSDGQFRPVVFDPSLANAPVSADEWRRLANCGSAYCWPMSVKWYGPKDHSPIDRYGWLTVHEVTGSGEKQRSLERAQRTGWAQQNVNVDPNLIHVHRGGDWRVQLDEMFNFLDELFNRR
jgi:hypothetical protein